MTPDHLKASVRGAMIVHDPMREQKFLGEVLRDLLHYAQQFSLDFEGELDWAKKSWREDNSQ